MDGRLDRDAHVFVDQLAQRNSLEVLHGGRLPGTLAHGAFLRWPPARAAGWSCTSPTGRMRHLISTRTGTPPALTAIPLKATRSRHRRQYFIVDNGKAFLSR
jgi:hypothetical protein